MNAQTKAAIVPSKEWQVRPTKGILRLAALLVLSVAMIYPILWMITIALSSNSGMFKVPPEWFPREFHFRNFIDGADTIHFLRVFSNSLIITGLITLGQTVSSLLIGYGISRIQFPGRRMWFFAFLGSMMLPQIVSLIPVFYIFAKLGLYNTWWPLILTAYFGNPFFIFLSRQFLSSIPFAFDEAAKIEGASHLQILTRIIVPISMPLVATMVILAFQASWNEYLLPLIYLRDADLWPLSMAIAAFSSQYGNTWNLFMAANLLYMLPVLLLFFFSQKYFMQGLGSLNSAGIK
ncbi:carbohydrate ABC transporter permease [Cohnella silvisoli]|uniref:Carbohydrate ABC transporter permease n=1 Tax=Cohnella silvisoli TaxID=2873699 RepID=A0ABV1KR52_9BACL|nr:carbohydrate ABC transporter permease [Cohnella silvisoli]MCD9024498.1 carbohydrate ABC transporter permease [Cohnella silvisoli]